MGNFTQQEIKQRTNVTTNFYRPASLLFVLALTLASTGCQSSENLPVSGHVTTSEGTPLVGASLMMRSDKNITCTAFTDEEGYYNFGVVAAGDGAPAGTYRISIMEDRGDPDRPRPQQIHMKYGSPGTSGLTIRVPEDGSTYDVVLDPPGPFRKKRKR